MVEDSAVKVALRALTLEAQSALHAHERELETFPYRVGRESRSPNAGWAKTQGPERRAGASPTNDLYLWEKDQHSVHVSREHFEIVQEGDEFYLVDRCSALGTWVEGQLVGGNRRGGKVRLQPGHVIIVGSYHSGFIFKFVMDE